MRNKEATKNIILDAAKKIMARDGFAGLKINNLALKAGVGKPLIYRYFKDLNGVVEALVLGNQGASPPAKNDVTVQAASEVVRDLIVGGRELAANRLSRDLMLWSLSSEKVAEVLDRVGASGEPDNIMDGTHVRGLNADREAIYAILKAAIAFMVLYRDQHQQWAGLSLSSVSDMARFEMALADIVKKVWD